MFKRVLLLCLILALGNPVWAGQAPARVVVLSTLHTLHASVPAYGFDTLARIIEQLHPAVLCVEVTPSDLKQRAREKVKVEYPRVIYPLIDRHHYAVYALEPGEPLFSRMVQPYVASARAFRDDRPDASRAFEAWADSGLDALELYWSTPQRVNDAVTDAVFAGKHALQEAMVGAGERTGWEGWNRHFLAVVKRAASEHPGERIVVTVGAEHGYWLRRHLVGQPGIELEDTPAVLTTVLD